MGNFDRAQERVLTHWPPGDKWSTIGRCCGLRRGRPRRRPTMQQLCAGPVVSAGPSRSVLAATGKPPPDVAPAQPSRPRGGPTGAGAARRCAVVAGSPVRWQGVTAGATLAPWSLVSGTLVLVPRAAKQTTSHCSCSGSVGCTRKERNQVCWGHKVLALHGLQYLRTVC